MAESRQELVITADVGQAQRGLDGLADSSRGATTAVENTSAGLKTASKAAAEMADKAAESREAMDKLRRETAAAATVVQAFGKDSKEAEEALERVRLAQEGVARASKAQADATERAAKATADLGEAADGKAAASVKRLNAQIEKSAKEADKAATDLRGLEARIHALGGAAKGMGAAMSAFVGNLAANAVSSLTGRLADVGLHALDTAANFERMRTALATTLGGTEAAAKAFEQLQGFAAATPYSLEEVTNGFLKLKARGLDGSDRALRAWGDTASAMGKSLDDMVEAVADATTGEFERLKEFGVKASSQGDKVALTFRGVTTTVAKEAKAIEAELMRLGEVNFAGGMEAQSRTLGGMWSTIKDKLDQLIVGVMESGISDALKSIMGSFSGMGETGALLGDILGVTLGGAFTVLAGTVKVAATAVEAFSTAVNFLLTPIRMVKDEAASLATDIFAQTAAAAEKAAASQRDLDAAYWESAKGSGSLAADMQGLIDLSGQYALSIAAEGLAHLEAANAADRRMASEAALWKKLEERNAKAEEKAIEEAFFAANEMGPALPPGFKEKKKGNKAKKGPDLSGQGMEAAKRYEAETRREREQAFAAEVAAFERESALRDQKIAGIGRELAALEAQGVAQREQVDVLLWSIEIESEAEAKREALIDARIAKEEELARWQVRAARTEEQREKARTRLDEAQHQARLRVLQRTAREEEREHSKREKAVAGVVGAVVQLGETMMGAIEAMVQGEKGAIAEALSDLLKSVAKKNGLLALEQFALAAGSAAMYDYGGAAAHTAAGGLHLGVAAAAGVGAYAAGQVADARQGGGGGGGASPFGAASTGGGGGVGGGGRSRGGSQRRSDLGDVEAEDIPISSEQARRGDPSMHRGQGGAGPAVSITINGSVVGEGGMNELARTVTKHQQRAGLAGRSPRI